MDSSSVSMIQSSYEARTEVKQKNPLKIVVIILLVLVLILGGVVAALALIKSDTLASDEIDDGEEMPELELIENADANAPLTIWSLSKNAYLQSAGVQRVHCQTLAELSKQYSNKNGVEKMDSSICETSQITIATGYGESDEYPFAETHVIYIKTGNKYARFQFDSGFEVLYQYDLVDEDVENPVTLTLKNVEAL